jgi:hypothetical protein
MRRLMISSMALLGGLTLCGAALAADPAPGTTEVIYNGMKVGIDPTTGKLRPLSEAESRKLDLALTGGQGPAFKTVTRQQALSSKKALRGGGIAIKTPTEMMTTITATRNNDGSVTLSEGEHSEGAPNE